MQGRPDSPWSQHGPTHTHTTHDVLPNIHTYFYLFMLFCQSMLCTNTHEAFEYDSILAHYRLLFLFYSIGIKSCWWMWFENTWMVWTDHMTCEPLPLKTLLLWDQDQRCFIFSTFVVEVKWLCYGAWTMHSKLCGIWFYFKLLQAIWGGWVREHLWYLKRG